MDALTSGSTTANRSNDPNDGQDSNNLLFVLVIVGALLLTSIFVTLLVMIVHKRRKAARKARATMHAGNNTGGQGQMYNSARKNSGVYRNDRLTHMIC